MTVRQRAIRTAVWGWAACVGLVAPAAAGELPFPPRQGCTIGAETALGRAAARIVAPSQNNTGDVARITTSLAIDGSAVVRVVSGDLEVVKRVWPTGMLTLRLQRGDDLVVIQVEPGSIGLSRGGRIVRISPETAAEEEFLAVRELLAGSRSVRALRGLGAAIARTPGRSPAGLAVALSDALVGMLDGDLAAVERLAERLGGARTATTLVSSADGCYERWEKEVIRAWDDYEACVAVYPSVIPWRDACGLRWVLWAESAWFSFLKCAGSPFINS